MVIALDASSTCWYLARQLPDINLHVFTNSQPICGAEQTRTDSAHLLRRYAPAKIWLLRQPSLISQLKSLEIDLFIFSCEGIDSHGALWDSNTVNAVQIAAA
jgi:DeoR family L-fucose operon activator